MGKKNSNEVVLPIHSVVFRVDGVEKPSLSNISLQVEKKKIYFGANWTIQFKDLDFQTVTHFIDNTLSRFENCNSSTYIGGEEWMFTIQSIKKDKIFQCHPFTPSVGNNTTTRTRSARHNNRTIERGTNRSMAARNQELQQLVYFFNKLRKIYNKWHKKEYEANDLDDNGYDDYDEYHDNMNTYHKNESKFGSKSSFSISQSYSARPSIATRISSSNPSSITKKSNRTIYGRRSSPFTKSKTMGMNMNHWSSPPKSNDDVVATPEFNTNLTMNREDDCGISSRNEATEVDNVKSEDTSMKQRHMYPAPKARARPLKPKGKLRKIEKLMKKFLDKETFSDEDELDANNDIEKEKEQETTQKEETENIGEKNGTRDAVKTPLEEDFGADVNTSDVTLLTSTNNRNEDVSPNIEGNEEIAACATKKSQSRKKAAHTGRRLQKLSESRRSRQTKNNGYDDDDDDFDFEFHRDSDDGALKHLDFVNVLHDDDDDDDNDENVASENDGLVHHDSPTHLSDKKDNEQKNANDELEIKITHPSPRQTATLTRTTRQSPIPVTPFKGTPTLLVREESNMSIPVTDEEENSSQSGNDTIINITSSLEKSTCPTTTIEKRDVAIDATERGDDVAVEQKQKITSFFTPATKRTTSTKSSTVASRTNTTTTKKTKTIVIGDNDDDKAEGSLQDDGRPICTSGSKADPIINSTKSKTKDFSDLGSSLFSTDDLSNDAIIDNDDGSAPPVLDDIHEKKIEEGDHSKEVVPSTPPPLKRPRLSSSRINNDENNDSDHHSNKQGLSAESKPVIRKRLLTQVTRQRGKDPGKQLEHASPCTPSSVSDNDDNGEHLTRAQVRKRRRVLLGSNTNMTSIPNSSIEGFFSSSDQMKSPMKTSNYSDQNLGQTTSIGKKQSPIKVSNPYKKSNFFGSNKADGVSIGLRNLGNTCYLNSSLQMLFSIPGFINELDALYKKQEYHLKAKDKEEPVPLTKALLNVAKEMKVLPSNMSLVGDKDNEDTLNHSAEKDSKKMSADPTFLKKTVDKLTDKFAGYEQRDAHEFFSDLIDSLHDELVLASEGGIQNDLKDVKEKHRNEKNGATKDLLPTDTYFRMDIKVCLTCDSCGYSRCKEEMYRHLSIEVNGDNDKQPWAVQKGLEQFFQAEKREIKCEKCKEGQSATQTMEMMSRPKALLLHLKRFIFTQKPATSSGIQNVTPREIAVRKNKARVVFNESLSVHPYYGNISGSSANQNVDDVKIRDASKYYLRGVVHHIGSTAFSGHYTTDAIRVDHNVMRKVGKKRSDWVTFDDTVTTMTSIANVLEDENSQRNSYMILYGLEKEKDTL